MRTNWRLFRKVAFLVIMLGLILTACDSSKAYYAGEKGLVISIQGQDEYHSDIVIETQSKTFEVEASDLKWYYDVEENEPEYLIVQSLPSGSTRYVSIHRHKSQMPANFKK